MRCSATTHRGIRCKRIGKGTDQNTQLLCKEHLQIVRRHTCVYFLPKQRRYCKVSVGPNGRLCKRHDGMAGIVQWGLLPSIVWANVAKCYIVTQGGLHGVRPNHSMLGLHLINARAFGTIQRSCRACPKHGIHSGASSFAAC